jgi:hypothetical protein
MRDHILDNLPTNVFDWFRLLIIPVVVTFSLLTYIITAVFARLRRNSAACAEELGWQCIGLSPEAFSVSNQQGTFQFKWHTLLAIRYTENYTFFIVGANSAFILPLRAFAQWEEYEDFVKEAEWFHGNRHLHVRDHRIQ